MSEYGFDVVFVSVILRVTVCITTAFAVHDVVRNGLHIHKVPAHAKIALFCILFCVTVSAAAAVSRLAGVPWRPENRELSQVAMSVAMIVLCVMVIRSKTCVRDVYHCETGLPLRDNELAASCRVYNVKA